MRRKEEKKLRQAEEAKRQEQQRMAKEKNEQEQRRAHARMMEAAKAAKMADQFLESKWDRRPACIDRSNTVL